MYFVKKSQRHKAKVSFILLDWNVRESFHILHYLMNQNCNRIDFEVIVIEYYNREFEGIRAFEEQVDTWIIMEVPEKYYYHKHLMYNIGILCSHGKVVSICDSDAIVSPNFVNRIIDNFSAYPDSVFHIDQFRNNRQDLYPFNYPDIKTVIGKGCINNIDGKTSGVCDIKDPIHSRNYGACMCARREDLISIGGADEHIDFLGYICGPYDLTFRLVNKGLKEIWAEDEFMYHTWHPGQAGDDNYHGPHDGRNISSTSLLALISKRIYPLVENEKIYAIRKSEDFSCCETINFVFNKDLMSMWGKNNILERRMSNCKTDRKELVDIYYGAKIYQENNIYTFRWIVDPKHECCLNETVKNFSSKEMIKKDIYSKISLSNKFVVKLFMSIINLSHYASLSLIFVSAPSKMINYLKSFSKLKRSNYQQSNSNKKLVNLLIYILSTYKNSSSLPVIVMNHTVSVMLSIKILQILKLLPKLSIESVKDFVQVKKSLENNPQLICVPADTYIQFYTEFKRRDINSLMVV